jgi:succinyl-diaminopimelate desuccinylase
MNIIDIEQQLTKLMAMYPLSSNITNCNNVVDYLKDFLDSYGLYTTIENYNTRKVLYVSTIPGKVQNIFFSAHLDVVPIANENQHIAQVKDGILLGRGSSDCLGNVLAIVATLIRCKDKYSCGAIFNTDEEIGGESVKYMLEQGYKATKSVVVSDHFEQNKITYREKGILNVTLKAQGNGGHAAALMDKKDNTIDRVVDAYLKIREVWQNPKNHTIDWADSLNGTMMHGSDVVNQVPAIASMVLNIRYTVPSSAPSIVEKLQKIVGNDIKIEYHDECSPVTTDINNPQIKKFQQCYSNVVNSEIGFTHMCGATDARHYVALNVPIIITGVEGKGPHSNNEFVKLDSILTFSEIYYQFVSCNE